LSKRNRPSGVAADAADGLAEVGRIVRRIAGRGERTEPRMSLPKTIRIICAA
jgi:hypothetical protein